MGCCCDRNININENSHTNQNTSKKLIKYKDSNNGSTDEINKNKIKKYNSNNLNVLNKKRISNTSGTPLPNENENIKSPNIIKSKDKNGKIYSREKKKKHSHKFERKSEQINNNLNLNNPDLDKIKVNGNISEIEERSHNPKKNFEESINLDNNGFPSINSSELSSSINENHEKNES